MSETSAVVTVVVALLLILCGTAAGSVAPPRTQKEKGFPVINLTEDRRVVVQDPVNEFQLVLPAPYWETKTPGQIASERGGGAGGGCAPGQQVPESLLLVMRNEDARAAASLELKPERFRMRGREDLEDYVDERNEMVMQQGGGAFELDGSSYEQRNGLIVHQASFTASGERGRQKYVVIDYFVRPRGQKARVYQLACISTPERFEGLRKDFEHIIESFEFTGEVAEGFFTPDASPAELPEVKDRGGPLQRCGGGSYGMFIAMAVVFIVYMVLRRRGEKSGPGLGG
jgi:hypothetical protein